MLTIPSTFEYNDQSWGVPEEYRDQYNRLQAELVPPSGHCDTVNGELLRAASKICHDYFNNGWGCNNWSGAVIFMMGHLSSQTPEVRDALAHVYRYSHGEPIAEHDDSYTSADIHAYACYVIMKAVLEFINRMPATISNKTDMWDFQEDSYRHEYEEEGC